MTKIEWTAAEREAIGGHQAIHSSGNWPWRCECGEEYRTSTGHALHVRDAALDALAPHVAARAAKALREAAEWADNDDVDEDGERAHLYNGDVGDWLRAHADRIERGETP